MDRMMENFMPRAIPRFDIDQMMKSTLGKIAYTLILVVVVVVVVWCIVSGSEFWSM